MSKSIAYLKPRPKQPIAILKKEVVILPRRPNKEVAILTRRPKEVAILRKYAKSPDEPKKIKLEDYFPEHVLKAHLKPREKTVAILTPRPKVIAYLKPREKTIAYLKPRKHINSAPSSEEECSSFFNDAIDSEFPMFDYDTPAIYDSSDSEEDENCSQIGRAHV